MLSIIVEQKLRSIQRFFATDRFAKAVTVLGFFLVFGFLATIVYECFFYGFRYIARDAYFNETVMLYVIELFYLVSFALVFLSALLTAIFGLFRVKNDRPLMASPRYRFKVGLLAMRMFTTSLWPLLVIMLPALLALHRVFALALPGFFLGLVASVSLVALATFAALALVIIVALFLLAFDQFTMRTLTGAIAVLFALLAILVWQRFIAVDLVVFFQAKALDASVSDITPVIELFGVFPSHLAALVVYFFTFDDPGIAIPQFAALVEMTLVTALLLTYLSKHMLLLWQKAEEGTGPVMQKGLKRMGGGLGSELLAHARTPRAAVIAKEIITFLRNPKGMAWLGFILFVWSIGSGASHLLSRGLGAERVASALALTHLTMLEFGIMLYFVAMFVLRFAFPSFSSEQHTTWMVASSPLPQSEVFLSKLRFFSSLFVLFVSVFALMASSVLGLAFLPHVAFVFAALVGTITLTSFGLSLGALYPNRETDDPERLSTTMPGLGFVAGALLYAALGAYAVTRAGTSACIVAVTVFTLCSLVGALLLSQKALRALRLSEY